MCWKITTENITVFVFVLKVMLSCILLTLYFAAVSAENQKGMKTMTALEYMEKQVQKHRRNYEKEAERGCPATMMHDILMKIHYYEVAVEALKKEDGNG